MQKKVLSLVALLAVGCSSGAEDVLDAWKSAGESPGEFKDAGAKLPGGKCQAGKVSGLDATVCEFESEEEAKKAAEAGWKLVGTSVGSSVASGKAVLVIADTRKEDPSGKRINTLVKAFKKETR